MSPTITEASGGVTSRLVTTADDTVTGAESVKAAPSSVPFAMMVAVPTARPVTSPLLPAWLLTLAIPGWLLCH
ncbi:hypothetical protein D3C76_1224640 [compost metagenome]